MIQLPFADRAEAGRLLAEEFAQHEVPRNAVVLALMRGGVSPGFAVANRLGLVLDLIVVRKIGVPRQEELAMGAIAGSEQILDGALIRQLRISVAEVEEVVRRERAEMTRLEELYRGGRQAADVAGKVALLIDDGVATGSTMIAAVRYARSLKPERVMVGVPVGSTEACKRLGEEADDVVCLGTPAPFVAVGQWYREFRQVTDEEVQELIAGRAAHS